MGPSLLKLSAAVFFHCAVARFLPQQSPCSSIGHIEPSDERDYIPFHQFGREGRQLIDAVPE
jgi:hypothetical protein